MARVYDFGNGETIRMTARSEEHREMFAALTALGPMGARIAKYINDMKAISVQKDITIAKLKGETVVDPVADYQQQVKAHQQEFGRRPPAPTVLRPRREFVHADSHTAGPWQMIRSGMIKAGNDWICAVTARNRRFNGPLIEVAPDMLAMLERMLSSPSPEEARTIISDARALVEEAKTPGWELPDDIGRAAE